VLGCVALLLCSFYFGTAAVGWQREKHDVNIIRDLIQEREAEIRSAIAEVGKGVPLEAFKKLLPNAYHDKKDEEWVVWIPTGYDENPACTNTYAKSAHFRLDESLVKPISFKSGFHSRHGDRFGSGGVRYYFWRAWHSSVDYYQAPSTAEK
jgi:hypothetical protein